MNKFNPSVKTHNTRTVTIGTRSWSEYICDHCLQPYADLGKDGPLHLAENGMEGSGRRATCHFQCYDALISKLSQ